MRTARSTPQRDDDAGFTLIEIAVTLVLAGILMSLAVGPFDRYRKTQQQIGSAREIVGALRETQSRSVSEECMYRVSFSPSTTNSSAARSYKIEKRETAGQCDLSGSWVTKSTQKVNGTRVWVKTASFDNLSADPDATSPGSVYFYPRGTGSPGSLVVARENSSKVYTVKVEGLTGRVSSDVHD